MGAIITAILPVLLGLLKDAPTLVADVEQAWELLTSGTPATPDEQAAIDAALEEAHNALQKS